MPGPRDQLRGHEEADLTVPTEEQDACGWRHGRGFSRVFVCVWVLDWYEMSSLFVKGWRLCKVRKCGVGTKVRG